MHYKGGNGQNCNCTGQNSDTQDSARWSPLDNPHAEENGGQHLAQTFQCEQWLKADIVRQAGNSLPEEQMPRRLSEPGSRQKAKKCANNQASYSDQPSWIRKRPKGRDNKQNTNSNNRSNLANRCRVTTQKSAGESNQGGKYCRKCGPPA